MLKKMRWRFIGAAMAAFTAVVLTLLCFHIGAAIGVGAAHFWSIRGALWSLPLLVWGFILVVQEEKAEAMEAIKTE